MFFESPSLVHEITVEGPKILNRVRKGMYVRILLFTPNERREKENNVLGVVVVVHSNTFF